MLLGVTRQTISSFESGKGKMKWSVFLMLGLNFFRNEPPKKLVALGIYTAELNAFLNISKNKVGGHENGNY